MSDNEKLLRRAEGLAGYRRVMMVVNALTYIAWVGTFTLGITGVGQLPHNLLVAISLGVFPVWVISMIALLWGIRRAARDRQVSALIDDERTLDVSRRSTLVGYWSLIVAIAVLWGISYVTPLDIRLCLPLLAAIGVAVPSLTYAFLYRS